MKLFKYTAAGLCGFLPLIFFSCNAADPLAGLKQEVQDICMEADAEIGVALVVDSGDWIAVNDDVLYPMMSVVKFHQALAVSHCLYEKGGTLDTVLHVTSADLREGTWSPLRDSRPEGDFDISVGELLTYTLQQSDNNACDILFDRIVSPSGTDEYIRSLPLCSDDFSIACTEADMMRDNSLAFANRTSPLAAAGLLSYFIHPDSTLPYKSFIMNTMIGCTTGRGRLAAPFAGTESCRGKYADDGVVVGHKTGSGYIDSDGRITATNDIGFFILPDGRSYCLAVFVKNSPLPLPETEKIISDISLAVYEYLK